MNQMLLYIDPGTGSIIVQAFIAGAVGIGIAVKLFWHTILVKLGIRKLVDEEVDSEEDS